MTYTCNAVYLHDGIRNKFMLYKHVFVLYLYVLNTSNLAMFNK